MTNAPELIFEQSETPTNPVCLAAGITANNCDIKFSARTASEKPTPEANKQAFMEALRNEFPAHYRLSEKLNGVEYSHEVLSINADFATELEDEIFLLINERNRLFNQLGETGNVQTK